MLQNLAGHHWGSGRCHWEKEDQSWKIYCSTWFQAVFLFLFLIRFPFSLGNYGSNHHGIAIFCIFREWGGRNIVPLIVQSSWQNALWQETSLSFFRPEQNVPIPLNTVSQYFLMSGVLFLCVFRTEVPNNSVSVSRVGESASSWHQRWEPSKGPVSWSRAVYAKLESNSEPERARVCQRVAVRASESQSGSHREP